MKDLKDYINESLPNDPEFRRWLTGCKKEFEDFIERAIKDSGILKKFDIHPRDINYACSYNSKKDQIECAFWIHGADGELEIDFDDVDNDKLDKVSEIIYTYVRNSLEK